MVNVMESIINCDRRLQHDSLIFSRSTPTPDSRFADESVFAETAELRKKERNATARGEYPGHHLQG